MARYTIEALSRKIWERQQGRRTAVRVIVPGGFARRGFLDLHLERHFAHLIKQENEVTQKVYGTSSAHVTYCTDAARREGDKGTQQHWREVTGCKVPDQQVGGDSELARTLQRAYKHRTSQVASQKASLRALRTQAFEVATQNPERRTPSWNTHRNPSVASASHTYTAPRSADNARRFRRNQRVHLKRPL